MSMQYDVKQAHLNASGIFVVGPTRVKGVSLTGTATAGQLTIFDTLTAPVTTGTYARSTTTVTVTQTAHGLTTGQVIGIDFTAYYENDEVMVGIHTAIEPDVAESSVMFIAKMKDGQVISHHYIREYDR